MSLSDSMRRLLAGNRSTPGRFARYSKRQLSFEALEPRHLLSMTVWLDFEPDQGPTFLTDLNQAVANANSLVGDLAQALPQSSWANIQSVVQPFQAAEVELIKAEVIPLLEGIFGTVTTTEGRFVFTDIRPAGEEVVWETITFYGNPANPNSYGEADFDWLNQTPFQTAHVYPRNLPDVAVLGADAFAREEGICGETLVPALRAHYMATWLAATAAHELGHTLGLDHPNCYGNVNIDPAAPFQQNGYVMATGLSGLADFPDLSQGLPLGFDFSTSVQYLCRGLGGRVFSPMSQEILRYALGSEVIMEVGQNGQDVLIPTSAPMMVGATTAADGETDKYLIEGYEGDCLTVLVVPHGNTAPRITVRNADGGGAYAGEAGNLGTLLPSECYRGQGVGLGRWVLDAKCSTDGFVFGSGTNDLSEVKWEPMFLNITLPADGDYRIVVQDLPDNTQIVGDYNLFVSLDAPDPVDDPDIRIGPFYSDGTNLTVEYEITGQEVSPFDISLFAVEVESNDLILVQRWLVFDRFKRLPGWHKAVIAPNLAWEEQVDYSLFAYIDDLARVDETNEANNGWDLGSGVFFDRVNEVIYAHGTDNADEVVLNVDDDLVVVELNGESFGPYDQTEVEFHVRTHGGNDAVLSDGDELTAAMWAFGGAGNDSLTGGSGNDYLAGGADNDMLEGGPGNDDLEGGSGNDYLAGGADNDMLEGGPGNDDLAGGDGDDSYWFSWADNLGSDTIDDSDGDHDKLYFTLLPQGVTIDLASTQSQQVTNQLVLTLQDNQIEDVYGTPYGDTIYGNALDNLLRGGDGNDHLFGMGGNDTLYGDANTDDLHGGDGVDTLRGGDDPDYLYGDAGDDYLYGDESLGEDEGEGDVLEGGTGDDYLAGGYGADVYRFTGSSDLGADELYDSHGDDTLDFGGLAGGVTVDLGDASPETAYGLLDLTLLNPGAIENVLGTAYWDELHGNDLDNYLSGGAGSDLLEGGYGDDELVGGYGNDLYRFAGASYLGADTIVEGDGYDDGLYDCLDFSELAGYCGGGGGVNIELANEEFQYAAWNLALTLSDDEGIEVVNGTVYGDVIKGNDRDNLFYGGYGNDCLHGYGGDDWLAGDWDNDFLFGDEGIDCLIGDAGNDFLCTYDGNAGDYGFGGDGYDVAYGDYGDFLDAETIEVPGFAASSATGGLDMLAVEDGLVAARLPSTEMATQLSEADLATRWHAAITSQEQWRKRRKAEQVLEPAAVDAVAALSAEIYWME